MVSCSNPPLTPSAAQSTRPQPVILIEARTEIQLLCRQLLQGYSPRRALQAWKSAEVAPCTKADCDVRLQSMLSLTCWFLCIVKTFNSSLQVSRNCKSENSPFSRYFSTSSPIHNLIISDRELMEFSLLCENHKDRMTLLKSWKRSAKQRRSLLIPVLSFSR